ncbi:MAG: demethoxyubiquinone hydroxylase family protein, partial [Caldimonas sp.]
MAQLHAVHDGLAAKPGTGLRGCPSEGRLMGLRIDMPRVGARTQDHIDAADPLPAALIADLRTDQAGESGAVMIYRGILAVTRDARVRHVAQAHLATEAGHLARIEPLLAPQHRSRLLPLWRLAGWLTGALPALVGPRAVFATIEAVETFVDQHYAEQIESIVRQDPGSDHPRLQALRDLLQT